MLEMLRRLIGEDIDLRWHPESNLWPVRMDPAQVDQILVNLCVNARDAIAGVGRIVIVTANATLDEEDCIGIEGAAPGDYVCLTVGDDGCGIEADVASLIFEPFFTTKELGKGTGLGLATVYGAVRQNQGFIELESAPGEGTTFRIYLPRHAGHGASEEAQPAAPVRAPGEGTILLVEDEPAILAMAAKMLERLGYSVLAAGTPGEAIRMARNHSGSIDLLLTDVVMPEMSGRDLARNVLSLHPDVKRLFISGYPAGAIAHEGELEQGVHFLQKPFTIGGLATAVRSALDGEGEGPKGPEG
jgi:CheY-like chemotaxis protein